MILLSHQLETAVVAFVVVVVQGIHPNVEVGSKEHPGFRLEDDTISTAASKGGCSFLDRLLTEFLDLASVESRNQIPPEENQQHRNEEGEYKYGTHTAKCNHQSNR